MIKLLTGDALTQLKTIDDESIDMMITSPPYYGLRNYGTNPVIWGGDENCEHKWGETLPSIVAKCGRHLQMDYRQGRNNDLGERIKRQAEVINDPNKDAGQFCQLCDAWRGELGSEPTVDLFMEHLLQIFDEVYRVLKPTGTCWINIGDTYNDKSHLAIPERMILGMLDRGWIKRNTIIWHKPSCLPSNAKDRFTVDFDYMFFFVKQEKYYFEQQFEPQVDWGPRDRTNGKYVGISHSDKGLTGKVNPEGRNKRAVWAINPAQCKEAHFAVFPEELVITPIKAGCPKNGTVLDIFMGSGTVGKVCKDLDRDFVGIELNPEYMEIAKARIFPDQTDIFDGGINE